MSDAQQRIDDLVKQNDILLFMKGSASFPQCGFSGRAIQILKACGIGGSDIMMEMYENGELQTMLGTPAA